MNDKIRFVLNGFQNLKTEEKKEFFKLIEDFEKYPSITERDIKEALGMESHTEKQFKSEASSIVFGPSPSGCSCCGR